MYFREENVSSPLACEFSTIFSALYELDLLAILPSFPWATLRMLLRASVPVFLKLSLSGAKSNVRRCPLLPFFVLFYEIRESAPPIPLMTSGSSPPSSSRFPMNHVAIQLPETIFLRGLTQGEDRIRGRLLFAPLIFFPSHTDFYV